MNTPCSGQFSQAFVTFQGQRMPVTVGKTIDHPKFGKLVEVYTNLMPDIPFVVKAEDVEIEIEEMVMQE